MLRLRAHKEGDIDSDSDVILLDLSTVYLSKNCGKPQGSKMKE